jgi:hypothetical protein
MGDEENTEQTPTDEQVEKATTPEGEAEQKPAPGGDQD